MSNEKKQILEMLAQGKITVSEAENLLAALGSPSENPQASSSVKTPIKFMRISVDSAKGEGDKVNIKIPIKFLKAGLKLTAFLPESASAKVNEALEKHGLPMDLRTMKDADFTELIEALSEMEINVQDKGGENVRIFCE